MKKKNYKFLNYLGFVLLMLPLGNIAMNEGDVSMNSAFGQLMSNQNDVPMSALLSNESAFDMESAPPHYFKDDEPDLSYIPINPECHPLHPSSFQYDETADAVVDSHAHSHSHSSTGISGGSNSAPHLAPADKERDLAYLVALKIVNQHDGMEKFGQQALSQSFNGSQELPSIENSRSNTHSDSHSSSEGFGSSISSASSQPAVTGLALLATRAIQQQSQQSDQQLDESPATMSSASRGNSKKNKSKSKGSKPKKHEKVKSELFGQCAEDIIKTVERSAEDKKAGVWTCEDSVCGKKIKGNQTNFKDHLRIHTGEKPCKCSICGAAFGKNSSLTLHMRIHTGEKRFKCKECKKKFTQKIDLQRHMRTHEKQVSELLGQCAEDILEIVKLERSVEDKEDGVWPCKDSACGKKIKGNQSNFKDHLRTHTGEKPYKCSKCGEAFTQDSGFRKHTCKAVQNSSSYSHSSSNSTDMADEEDEDAVMGDEGNEMEDSPSAPAGKIRNEHSGKKHYRDEDEDDSDYQPVSKKPRKSKK